MQNANITFCSYYAVYVYMFTIYLHDISITIVDFFLNQLILEIQING